MMTKRNYWPLFFIAIFGFTLYMIFWTIYKAVQLPTVEDKSFLHKYQYVDEHYNDIMYSNFNFLEKYNFKLKINNTDFGLTTEDIRYGQRVIEKHSAHRNILNLGQNIIQVEVIDKKTNQKQNLDIELVVTVAMTDDKDISLLNENFENSEGVYKTDFNLDEVTNYIFTGKFKVGEDLGYIYIKSNVKDPDDK